jgi:hypothetical protein
MSSETHTRPALGLLVVAAAALPYLAATNVIPSDDSDFGAPRWLVAWLVVVCFVYPGLLILGGVRAEDAGRTGRSAGFLGPLAAAVVPAALAVHAGAQGLRRAGGVQMAWFALALLTAWVAFLYFRRLARLLARRRR